MPFIGGKPCWVSLSLSRPKGKMGIVGLVGNVGIIGNKTDKILDI
jgi:hypothetical protein